MLSVRLHQRCDHKEEHWERKKCGHCWCRMCSGHVHPITRVALKGPSDVVRCNRRWHQLKDYRYLFRENCAGTGVLSAAVARAIGASKVAPPEDIKIDPETMDLLSDKVFERKKKEAKDRVCFLNHYAPNCRTFSMAQAQYQQRTMEEP